MCVGAVREGGVVGQRGLQSSVSVLKVDDAEDDADLLILVRNVVWPLLVAYGDKRVKRVQSF